nr:MAK10-like protein [Tanacetum cinerariifolium]
MGDKNPIRTLGDYSRTSHEGYRNTIELPEGNNVVILEDLALNDNESWNDPRDFAKPVKAFSLPQDVSSTSDRRLIELENQVQRLMEAHLTPTRPTHVNKITTPCKICSGYHDTLNCMEIPEQAFVNYASSHINKMGSKSTESDTDEDDTSSTSIHKHKLNDMVKGSEEIKEQSKEEDVIETDMEVEEVIEEEESEFETDEEIEEIFDEEEEDEYDESFNLFPTMKELSHHEWLLKHPRPPWVKAKTPVALSIATLEKCEENGTLMFKQGDEKITFRMPYTMEIFKQTRLMGFSIDSIPPFAYKENFGLGKTHYYQSLVIRDEYKQDDGGRRGIRHLMRLEKEMMNNKGELT